MSSFGKRKALVVSVAAALCGLEMNYAVAAGQLEEVVVTARKRAESLQDVPVVVQALSAAALEANGTTSFQDLNDQITGLTIQNDASVSPAIGLRGVTSDQTNIAGDSAVALNLDGVQHSSSQLFRFGLFDLESVEVLKGPQALFFGKNSPGGIIAMKTKNPTEEFYSELQLGYENAAERKYGHIILSGPLNDTWGARFGYKYIDQEGYFTNTWGQGDPTAEQPVDKTGPKYDSSVISATLRGEFERGDLSFKFYRGEQDGNEYNTNRPFGGCSDPATPIPDNPYASCKFDDTYSSASWNDTTGSRFANEVPFTSYEMTQITIDGNYEINDTWEFSNVIGWIEMDNSYYGNVGGRSDANQVLNSLALGNKAEVRSVSEEFRFSGDFDSYRVMFGGFMDDRYTNSGANVFVLESVKARPDAEVRVSGESWSVFAQAEFDLTDELELSVGARYTDEKRSVRGQSFEDYSIYLAGRHYFAEPSLTYTDTSPEVTLSWQPADNMNFFVSYKEGFKSGGYNSSTQDATVSNTTGGIAPRDNAYKNENIEGYEAGFKLQLLDNTLRVNGAFYSYDYSEMQLPVVLVVNGTPAPATENAGASSIDGFEVDAFWVTPIEPLSIAANFAYNDAQYDDYISDCSEWQKAVDPTGCVDLNGDGVLEQDRNGDPLYAAPEFSGSVNFIYDDSLTEALGLRANLAASYKGEQQLENFNDPRGVYGSYWMVNARVGVYAKDDSWAVDLIAKNLTDKIAPVNVDRGSIYIDPAVGGLQMVYNSTAPRQIAVQVTFRPELF
jgi:iron complex outermembrane receptor protein